MADLPDDYAAWVPKPDEQRVKQDRIEEQKLISSVPLLQDVLDWFDAQIAEFKNPEIIDGVNVSTDAEQVKLAVLFAQTNIASYRQKRQEFATGFSRYLKEDTEVTDEIV